VSGSFFNQMVVCISFVQFMAGIEASRDGDAVRDANTLTLWHKADNEVLSIKRKQAETGEKMVRCQKESRTEAKRFAAEVGGAAGDHP